MRAALLPLLLLTCAPAHAQLDGRALLLAAIDVPLSRERLVAAGVDEAYAGATLADPYARLYVRARALAALVALEAPSAHDRLERVLRGSDEPELRIQAAIGLARAFTPSRETEALLTDVMREAPTRLRDQIARELDRVRHP